MDVLEYLRKKGETVNKEIDKLVPEEIDPEILAEASRHLIKAGGKRLRPVLTLTACEAVGGDSREILEAAAAIELLHTFTLIHDDMMDQDELRRGVKTVHEVWGDPIGIIAGDALFAKVFEALGQTAKKEDYTKKDITRIFNIVSKASLKICQGQAMDIEFEKRKKVETSEYLEMVEKKTGALMQTSTKVGAILGRGSKIETENLSEYGRMMGIAFQIQDDLIEVVGKEEKVGKPIGSDIKEGKWTFPAVKAFQIASTEKRDILLEALGKKPGRIERPEKAIDIYKETGAIKIAEEKAKNLIEKSKSKLEIFPKSEAKSFLLGLADFSINREF